MESQKRTGSATTDRINSPLFSSRISLSVVPSIPFAQSVSVVRVSLDEWNEVGMVGPDDPKPERESLVSAGLVVAFVAYSRSAPSRATHIVASSLRRACLARIPRFSLSAPG